MPPLMYELAILTVAPELRTEYVNNYKHAFQQAEKEGAFAGTRRAHIMKCIEEPNRVAVLVEWESMEAFQRHVQVYTAWTALADAERAANVPSVAKFRQAVDLNVADSRVLHYQGFDQTA